MRTLHMTFVGLLTLGSCAARIEDRHAAGGSSGPGRGILATGTCIKKITQDRAAVTFTTTVLAPTPTESSQAATKDSEALRAAVTALKLQDATYETSGFSVFEERDYQNKKTVSKGFRTRIGLSVETSDIGRLGEAIAAASKLGVKEIDNLSTFVSPQKMKTEYESCLEIAASNARDKADKLAKGTGVHLGKVLSIEEGAHNNNESENYSRGVRSLGMAPMADAAQADVPAPMITTRAENITVSASVKFAVD